MATVELKNLSKTYSGNVQAVQRANITIKDGEFLVLVGPSGCGKTTTLRMIAGLEEITAGDLYIDGKRMNKIAPKDRDVAMVFQNYALYPHMSVYGNMSFGLRIRKYPKAEIKRRVLEAAQILDIERLLERKPKALSGGEKQRVAVGRAIVRKPKVFLFDEPLSNLDAKLRVQMRGELSALHAKLKATMIYVTHDQVEAMTMGDKIVVQRDGVIQQIGKPLELYNSPANRFVAGFIGSPPMNIFEVNVFRFNEGITLSEGKSWINLIDDSLRPYIGKVILFGVRPEDLGFDNYAVAGSNIRAKIEVIEPLGAEIHLYVNTGSNKLIVRAPSRHDFKIGDEINLSPNIDKLSFFDIDTGEVIR